jgi:flavodoxin
MKTLVIYDSQYGNTEQIAKAIGGAITGEVKVVKVGEANPAELASYDLLIIGSPTQGGRHTAAMKAFLNSLPADALKNKSVACFDTRLKTVFVKLFGWAANRIADVLRDKESNLVEPGEGFFVKSTKGPLADGELERAAAWAKGIAAGKK